MIIIPKYAIKKSRQNILCTSKNIECYRRVQKVAFFTSKEKMRSNRQKKKKEEIGEKMLWRNGKVQGESYENLWVQILVGIWNI